MRSLLLIVLCTLLPVHQKAHAGHISKGSEANVVMLYCALDNSKQPASITVEAVSINATRHPLPNVRPGASCAQALHEYLTAGFEIVNRDTATTQFVLVREDKAIVQH